MTKILVVFAVLLLCLSLSTPCCLAKALTKDAIVTKAKTAVQKYGIMYEGADIVYDKTAKRWEERVMVIDKEPANPNHGKLPHGILKDKKYEVVLFDFKEGAEEADAWVFLDPATGDVLTIYQEK